MKIYKELESLGFFEWLSETHNLKDTDMKPEYLDELPLNDIHRTVGNSMAFRWFREKDYYSEINVGCTQIGGAIGFSWRIWKPWIIEEWSPERPGEEWSYETYEEAESVCLNKLIEITKNK